MILLAGEGILVSKRRQPRHQQPPDPLSRFCYYLHDLKKPLFELALFIIFVLMLYAFVKHEVSSFLDSGSPNLMRPPRHSGAPAERFTVTEEEGSTGRQEHPVLYGCRSLPA
jgi:hypothetical protein